MGTASSALRPAGFGAVVAYTCHLAQGLGLTSFEKHLLCFVIPTPTLFVAGSIVGDNAPVAMTGLTT